MKRSKRKNLEKSGLSTTGGNLSVGKRVVAQSRQVHRLLIGSSMDVPIQRVRDQECAHCTLLCSSYNVTRAIKRPGRVVGQNGEEFF